MFHENTGVFIGKKLIQHLGISNPTKSYVTAVGEAFRTGRYGGKVFSGLPGDLAAVVTAVMLHSDAAQFESGPDAATQGSLREPMVKVIHLLRSMEYKDGAGDPVFFRELQDLIGQYPYQAPSVFNFFSSDFELPMESMMSEPESEPEAEAEAEAEAETESESGPVLGPEFEIFTPFYFTNFLNVMFSIIAKGVSFSCDGEYSVGLHTIVMENGNYVFVCPQGSLTLAETGSLNETISNLDMLLTGGRLTPHTRGVVLDAYNSAEDGAKMQAAQKVIAMSAEFNTLGNPLGLDIPRAEVPPEPVKSNRQAYKVLIFFYLTGGADTFNLLVPQNCDLYNQYVAARADLALSPAELLSIWAHGQNCSSFGIHSSFPLLKSLYDMGEASFVTNIGGLVAPLSMNEWTQRTGSTCYGLFSHSDQTTGAQTLKCQDFGRGAKGFGGRIMDAITSGGSYSYAGFAYSMAGTAIFPVGVETGRSIMNADVSGLNDYDKYAPIISNLTSKHHGNVFAEAYAVKFLDAIETTEEEKSVRLAGLSTSYDTETHLDDSFKAIASVISMRDGRGSERDMFYVSYGGWDMHANLKQGMKERLTVVDDALTLFVAELRAQGVWESTVLMSSSEFGRTLNSNGGGSDHAWAGNYFLMGGALQGGQVLTNYPWDLRSGSARDIGRGRFIPDYPWESIAVPVAEWMGVEDAQKATVFPNVGNFASNVFVPRSSVFKT